MQPTGPPGATLCRLSEPGRWQRHAARTCGERACETHLAELSPASRALLLPQAGPLSARAFTVAPTHDGVVIPSAQFRVLLFRRFRLPLPLPPRLCGCHGRLDALGDHRTACATTGALASRALLLERAVARVCRAAGARVSRNVRVADMNIDVPVADARRIEVVANGLPLRHGSQLALDATMVSPVTRTGEPHPRADTQPGWAANNAARRKRRDTYPELTRARRCRLVALAARLQPSCACSPGSGHPPCQPTSVRLHKRPGSRDGRRCLQSQPRGHTQPPCWSSQLQGGSTAMKPCLTYRSCWPTPVGNSPSWLVASQPGRCRHLPTAASA